MLNCGKVCEMRCMQCEHAKTVCGIGAFGCNYTIERDHQERARLDLIDYCKDFTCRKMSHPEQYSEQDVMLCGGYVYDTHE